LKKFDHLLAEKIKEKKDEADNGFICSLIALQRRFSLTFCHFTSRLVRLQKTVNVVGLLDMLELG